MKNSAKRARAEAWTTKTKHSRGKTLQGNNKEILGNNISGAQKEKYSLSKTEKFEFEQQSKKKS
jgi:hypothetical protein